MPHCCTVKTANIACRFADDWKYARERCKYYDTEYKWAIYVIYSGIWIKISDNFNDEKSALEHIDPCLKHVFVRKIKEKMCQ